MAAEFTPAPPRTRWQRRMQAMDRAVDLGFAVLLVVCALRYFSRHELVGEGIAVLALAIGAGASYAVAVVGRRPEPGTLGPGLRAVGTRQAIGLVVATCFWLPLTLLAPSFGWCAFALFFAVHRVLRGRIAFLFSGAIVVAVSAGLLIMSKGQDLGLVLGPFFGGLVLTYAYAALESALTEQQHLIAQLIDTRRQLARSEREAGAAAERGRVASELHDTVVQRTATALLLLESDGLQPAGSSQAVLEARETLREGLVETRQLLHGLASPASTATLSETLRSQAETAGAEYSAQGTARPVPDPVFHALQRIVQESLLNAHKHASATRTRVELAFSEDAVTVKVSDDGAGFRPGSTEGFGIRAMSWRADNLGGTIVINSAPGQGTSIEAELPLSHEGDPQR